MNAKTLAVFVDTNVLMDLLFQREPYYANAQTIFWLAEQKRIASEVKRLFALIDIIEEGKASLEDAIKQAKRKVLELAVNGKLSDDNRHYENICKNWSATTLGKIGKWQAGGTPSRSNKAYYQGDIPWLKIADLTDGTVEKATEYITADAIKNSSAKINPQGSIALAMYGSIGKIGILDFPAATNQAICVCSQFKGVSREYLYYYLLSQRSNFISKAGGGVQANISKEIIIKYPLLLPTVDEQNKIVCEIESIFAILDFIQCNLI